MPATRSGGCHFDAAELLLLRRAYDAEQDFVEQLWRILPGERHFDSFAAAASTASRGFADERLELVFAMLDSDCDGFVRPSDVPRLCSAVDVLIARFGDPALFPDAGVAALATDKLCRALFVPAEADWPPAPACDRQTEQRQLFDTIRAAVESQQERFEVEQFLSVNRIGAAKPPPPQFDRLTREEFPPRARPETALLDCFAFFRLLYWHFVHPIELTLYNDGYERVVSVSGARIEAVGKTKLRIDWPSLSGGVASLRIGFEDGQRDVWLASLRLAAWQRHAFGATSPPRAECGVEFLVTGSEYFAALLDALSRAERRVLIAGYMLAPGVLLQRDGETTTTLAAALQSVRARGVEVFALPWNAPASIYDFGVDTVVERTLRPLGVAVNADPAVGEFRLWLEHQKVCVVDDALAFVGGIDLTYGRYDVPDQPVTDPAARLFPGHDYLNFSLVGDQNGPTDQVLVDRCSQPRTPWQDVHARLAGPVVADVVRNFVERWNHVVAARRCTPPDRVTPAGVSFADVLIMPLPPSPSAAAVGDTAHVQLLRSVSTWSAGVATPESSIHSAYVHAIEHAKRFVYIENQYFISFDDTYNSIAEALYRRLDRAIRRRRPFRLVVVLPVAPAGTLGSADASGVTDYMIRLQQQSIAAGAARSLLARLAAQHPDARLDDYVGVFALRHHGRLAAGLVTEQVYVHAKLLIADDRLVLLGSANITDRSMRGHFDSELAFVCRQPAAVAALRQRLWCQHLGLDYPQQRCLVSSPVAPDVWRRWRVTADLNTTIYRAVFPDLIDNLRSIDQLPLKNTVDPSKLAWLPKIVGGLVNWPLLFPDDAAHFVIPTQSPASLFPTSSIYL